MVYRRKKQYRRHKHTNSKSSVRALVKREISRKLELKHSTVNGTAAISTIPQAINPFDYIYSEESVVNPFPRDGNQVDVTGMMIRSMLEGADSPYNRIRILFLTTREQLPVNMLGTTYDATSVFDPIFSSQGINCPLDRTSVVRVFMDKTFNLQRNVWNVGLTGRNVMQTVNRFFKKAIKVQWGGETLSTDNVGTNLKTNFYMVVLSDSATIPHPSLTYALKTFYTDS